MKKEQIAARSALDDLIIRLERDLAFHNVRLENCRDPSGTFGHYLKSKIQVTGTELARVRNERVKHYGPFEETPKLPHRVRLFSETSSMPTNRLDDARKAKQGRNSRKPNQNRD